MSYLDTVIVTRSSAGSQSADGSWTPGSDTTLYSGKVDYQEMGVARVRRQDDDLEETANGRFFLPPPKKASTFEPGDAVALTLRGGESRTGRVLRVSIFDNTVHVLT